MKYNENLLKEFYDNKAVINCETEKEAEEFLQWLDSKGFTWFSGNKLTKHTNWCSENHEICYFYYENKRVTYSRYVDRNKYKLIKYSELKEDDMDKLYTDLEVVNMLAENKELVFEDGKKEISADDYGLKYQWIDSKISMNFIIDITGSPKWKLKEQKKKFDEAKLQEELKLYEEMSRFSWENGGDRIDYIGYQDKYYLYAEKSDIKIGRASVIHRLFIVYFISEEVAQQAIELFGDRLKKLRGVE